MRLIDAEQLLKFFDFPSREQMRIGSIKRTISQQPTAYDVEKVVEQLEEHKRVAREGVQSYDCVPLNKAIEIVKGGGLNG